MSIWARIKEWWRLYWYGERYALEELVDTITAERNKADQTVSTLERLGDEVRRARQLDHIVAMENEIRRDLGLDEVRVITYSDGTSITEVAEQIQTAGPESLWGAPAALNYNEITEAMEAIAGWGVNARDIKTINWWEEHDMVIDTSEIRHDEVVAEAYWEYAVRDGDGDFWSDVWTTNERDERQILEWFEDEIDDVRKFRDGGHQWYPAEHYPEPLTIVKRHVRVTTEYSNWEEA